MIEVSGEKRFSFGVFPKSSQFSEVVLARVLADAPPRSTKLPAPIISANASHLMRLTRNQPLLATGHAWPGCIFCRSIISGLAASA